MSIVSDLAHLDHKFRAKRTGQTPMEYAAAIERYSRPVTWKTWAMRIAAVCLLIAAAVAGRV